MAKSDPSNSLSTSSAPSSSSSVTASPVVSLEPKSKGAPNGWLSIRIPLDPQTSKSGKSLVIASTHGSIPTEVEFQSRKVFLGLNAYCYEPKNGKGD
jgi:hypothetical protein